MLWARRSADYGMFSPGSGLHLKDECQLTELRVTGICHLCLWPLLTGQHVDLVEDLFCGAEAGAHGPMDGAPMAGDVGVLASEVEGAGDRFGHEG